MNKLIVVNKGHAGVGKSSSIKLVFEKLKALPSSVVNVIHDDGDITATIEVNGTVVGIETKETQIQECSKHCLNLWSEAAKSSYVHAAHQEQPKK